MNRILVRLRLAVALAAAVIVTAFAPVYAHPARAEARPPEVAILSPAAGAATNAATLDAVVSFNAGKHGVKVLVLTLDGHVVGAAFFHPKVEEATRTFRVELARVAEGEHGLEAFVFQGSVHGKRLAGSGAVLLLVDRTPPTITAQAMPPANDRGWNTTEVTVSFAASDTLSGLASVTDPVAVIADGGGQIVRGTAVDRAGNSATASVTVNLDRTPPALAITAPSDGAIVAEPELAVAGTADDVASGIATIDCGALALGRFNCTRTLADGANEVIVHAVDLAGNETLAGVTVTYESRLLPGPESAAALDAVGTYDSGESLAEAEIDTDAAGNRLARTRLELAFAVDATTAQVNGLLRSIGARIDDSLAGVLILVVKIPDPGSLAALDQLVAQLSGDPLVRRVIKGYLLEPSAIARSFGTPPSQADLRRVRHQLAVRAHAAWNARAALLGAVKPTVLVADFFGGGPPSNFPPDAFDVNVEAADFDNLAARAHGYHVTGIIAGNFGGNQDEAGQVTGIFPATTELRVLDIARALRVKGALEFDMIKLIDQIPGRIVLNTSLVIQGGAGPDDGLNWIEKVRGTGQLTLPGSGREARVVHATGAGNDPGPGVSAAVNSSFAAARLASMIDRNGFFVPPLTNTMVVENRRHEAALPFTPGCLSAAATPGGTISAIGSGPDDAATSDGPWSFFDEGITAGPSEGSSMATPQVAGVAAFVWSLDPDLTPAEVVNIVEGTRRPAACTPDAGSLVLDAYAAVLDTDRRAPAPALPPVRLAILDAAHLTQTELSGMSVEAVGSSGEPEKGDGRFEELDLELLAYRINNGGGEYDFSRFDLNGDGRNGGSERDRFDLDIDGAYGTVTQMIEGRRVTFDENALTDLQVLCYYAYSALYTGSEAARSNHLGPGVCKAGPAHVILTRRFDESAGPIEHHALETLNFDAEAQLAADGSISLTVSGSYFLSDAYTSGDDGEVCYTTSNVRSGSGSVTGAVFSAFGIGTLLVTTTVTGTHTVVVNVPTGCGPQVTTTPLPGTITLGLPARPIISGGRIVALDLNSNETLFGYQTIGTGIIPVAATGP